MLFRAALAERGVDTQDLEQIDKDKDVGWNLMGATGGLSEKFGKERVRNTPISEAGFVGAAAGAAMVGTRPGTGGLSAELPGLLPQLGLADLHAVGAFHRWKGVERATTRTGTL